MNESNLDIHHNQSGFLTAKEVLTCKRSFCPFYVSALLDTAVSPKTFFLKILFVYLRERERERENAQAGGVAGRGRGGEAGSPLSKNPDVRLDPKTLGS